MSHEFIIAHMCSLFKRFLPLFRGVGGGLPALSVNSVKNLRWVVASPLEKGRQERDLHLCGTCVAWNPGGTLSTRAADAFPALMFVPEPVQRGSPSFGRLPRLRSGQVRTSFCDPLLPYQVRDKLRAPVPTSTSSVQVFGTPTSTVVSGR